jgi:hypothetical protein
MLTEEDKVHYVEMFAPYIKGHAGQYVYRIKGQDTSEHLQKIGEVMQQLLVELQPGYGEEPAYQMFERVFGEHYRVEEKVLKVKVGKELSANSLQSPDTCTPWHLRPARKCAAGASVIWKQPSGRKTKSHIRATLSI